MKMYAITQRIESRDWGRISFSIEGVWPTFDEAVEALKAIKERQDKIAERVGDSKTGKIEVFENKAFYEYSDYDGNYNYEVECVNVKM